MPMSFYEELKLYREFDFQAYCSSVTEQKVRTVLDKRKLTPLDFLALLSDSASPFLEEVACRARDITRRNFGNVIFLFTPLYVSNLCENVCPYCSFSVENKISRKHLSLDEIRIEARRISETGIRHILVLTGEAPGLVDIHYLSGCVKILEEYFSSIAIEIYPLTEAGYRELIGCGVDALTIYQETYEEPVYKKLHSGGPKGDYRFRLDAPERACLSDIRSVTVGALLGLAYPQTEVFFSALHAFYLQTKYPAVEVALSFPRLRPFSQDFQADYNVDDKRFVQFLVASRIFLNTVGITISTRESAIFRDAVLPMGPTKMSAGVSTSVGCNDAEESVAQFEIADQRSVDQLKQDLLSFGFQPVMHDWNYRYTRGQKAEGRRQI